MVSVSKNDFVYFELKVLHKIIVLWDLCKHKTWKLLNNSAETLFQFFFFCRWSFPNVQSKGAYAATFVDRVEQERLPAALLKGYGLDNITNVIVGLTASLLKQANYDSPSSEVGCSVSNISRMLADLEVAVDVKCATLTRPFASPLKGGNEEDDDNTYIEYVSHIVDQGHNILSRSDFKANDVGLFISTLLSQEVANRKVPQVSSPIPRPTKSCRPDFLEAMKGAPTLVGEGKTLSQRKASGETVQIDTTEGLYYSTIQAVNLFNWLPRTCPAIVLHITDTRFRVQAVHLDCKHDIIRVYQRSCSAYNLEAVPSGLDIDDDVLKRFPSFSFYDRVSRDEINEHRGYLDKVGAGTKTSHAEAFKARQFAEAVARSLQMGKSAHEVHKKRQAEKSKRDQRRQELPGATESRGKPPKTPPTPSPTESHAEDECIPFMGDSYMLGREYDESETYRQKWKNLSSTLRTYIMSAWEAIDILVQLKLQQNEEEAARNYEASLQSGLFCPPQKFRLQNLIQPRGRNNEINAGDFMYDNCANWQTVDVSEVSPEFTHAVEATRADLAVRYLPPPPEQGIYQPPGAMWAQGAAAHEFVPTPQFKAQIHREVDAALQKEQDRA